MVWAPAPGARTAMKISELERRIRRVDRIHAEITDSGGRNLRGDRSGLRPYPFHHPAKASMTVASWRRRFQAEYPGLDARVFDRKGRVVHGRTVLRSVRSRRRS